MSERMMCTSITINKKKTITGWNLDLLGMEYRVRPAGNGVFIEINDMIQGWMPLFGANSRGDFVGMPTCWPFDERSNPPESLISADNANNGNNGNNSNNGNPESKADGENIIMLDIDLLLQKKTLQEIKDIANRKPVYSVPGTTFMASLSDAKGNVLHIVPGQGFNYYEKPAYKIMTNFSPFKQDSEKHPWMGWDRYQIADSILRDADEDFDVKDCFDVLKSAAQEVCPTVVSMVFDVTERTVHWCENRSWDNIQKVVLKRGL